MDTQSLSFCYINGVLIKNLHPFTNIFSKFDIELKRLVRFMMILYQISFIAIIAALVFGPYYRQSEKNNVER
jgi:hypothetical protein